MDPAQAYSLFGGVTPGQLDVGGQSALQALLSSHAGGSSTNSPASESKPRATNGSKGKKRAKEESPDSGDEQAAEGPKKPAAKRNRAALSCAECKRRKIKCDRKIPCEACCRRGEEKTCRWEASAVEPPPQPFALVSEHERLKERVAHLEQYILRTGGGSSPDDAAFQSFQTQLHRQEQQHEKLMELQPLDHDEEGMDELPDSDTEDAALVLEELALGRKLTRVGVRGRRSTGVVATPPVATPPPPPITFPSLPLSLTIPPASRAMASLLVPPLTPRRKLVLDDVWTSIPSSKPFLDWLISNYYARADWGWHLHHKPTFMAEYDAFTDLVRQGRRDEIDPLWIAQLLMTLCLSVNSLDGEVDSPLVSISAKDLETLPWTFFESAQSALECGDWTGRPRVRTLQAIVLFAPFLVFAGMPSAGERHQTYLGAAIRICQQLGLHKLGHDPSHMPTFDDAALPPGVNTMRREIPIRLFYTLLYLDYMAIKVKSSLPPPLVDCAPPGNFNDDDLSSESIVEPQPADVSTDVIFETVKYRIALQQRRFNEIINQDASFEYDIILDLDAEYRSIIDSLPPTMQADYIPPHGEDLGQVWKRHMCNQTLFNRLLRLHRPFMSRGLRDPKYNYSTTQAIYAARKTLLAQQHLQRAPLIKSGFQLLNVQGAVVVLFMSLWSDWPEELDNNSDHFLIRESVTFFERTLTSSKGPVRKIATQSLQVIGLLFEEFEKRRTASEARRAAGGSWSSDVDEESYGHLLKRIGAIVVSAASAASTTAGLDTLGAASHIVSDPHAGFAPVPPLPPVAAAYTDASFASSLWTNPGNLFDSMNDLDPDTPTTNGMGLALDFDVSSLQGPEYASSTFDWGGWTAVGSF